MKYYIKTFGCQANIADSERIATKLEMSGHKKGAKENADIIVLNACSVRKMAFDRVYGQVKELRNKKKELSIIIAGCVLDADRKNLINKGVEIWHPDEYFDLAPIFGSDTVANIPITSGCNNFCAYCAVPYTRGRERSRKAEEIIRDVKTALKKSIKEIWLLGQNVNSYRNSDKSSSAVADNIIKFPELLRMINAIPGDFWIRFTSPHPKDLSDDLIEAMKECQKFPRYLNLPLQSGDNAILKKMNRPYTIGHYKKLVKKIRKAMPDIAISTDIIVGFPGETEKQFKNTAKAMRELEFDMAFLSEYSPRVGTLAAKKYADDVPHTEKTRRKKILNDILTKTALKNNKKLVGKTARVLNNRTEGNKLVKIAGKYPKNKFIHAKVIKSTAWNLEGKLL